MSRNDAPPLENTILGPDDSRLIKTLTPEQAEKCKKAFRSNKGDPLRANVYYIDKEPFRLQPSVFHKGLKKFLRLHRFLLASHRSRAYERIDYGHYAESPIDRLTDFKPAYIGVIRFKGKQAEIRRYAE